MYRQTTRQIAPKYHRTSMFLLVAALAVAWVGYEYVQSTQMLIVGLAGIGLIGAYRFLNKSVPITLFSDGYIKYEYEEATKTAPQTASPQFRQLFEELTQFDEVETVKARQLSGTQFLQLQLTGGRVSRQMAQFLEEKDVKTQMRHPLSDNYYNLYVFPE